MTLFPKTRVCPLCKQPGVLTEDIYPHGTHCLHCGKLIETNTGFIVALVAGLVLVMLLDFKVLDIGYIGYVCAAVLFVLGGPMKWSHATLMPLRHYDED